METRAARMDMRFYAGMNGHRQARAANMLSHAAHDECACKNRPFKTDIGDRV